MTLTKTVGERNFGEFKKTIKAIILVVIGIWIVGIVLVAGGLMLLSAII